MRTTARVAEVSINTVVKLMDDAGAACLQYHEDGVRHVPAKKVQADEMFSFLYAREKNLPTTKSPAALAGTIWTWIAMEQNTKLVMSWMVTPGRNLDYARTFLLDLKSRIDGDFQLTTDGWVGYAEAVEDVFGADIDYAQLIKYKDPEHQGGESDRLQIKRVISGTPEAKGVSTSLIERQNLSVRMGLRRYTRRTNGHSKRYSKHVKMLAIYYMHYNFVRIHQTLGTTPAVQSGLSEDPWSLEDLIGLID